MRLFVKNFSWTTVLSIIAGMSCYIISLITLQKSVPLGEIFDLKQGLFYYLLCYSIQVLLYLIVFLLFIKFSNNIRRNNYFNSQNFDIIFKSTILIIIYATLNVIETWIPVDAINKEILSSSFFTGVVLLNIGGMMLNFLSIYNESEAIKEEHDLTI